MTLFQKAQMIANNPFYDDESVEVATAYLKTLEAFRNLINHPLGAPMDEDANCLFCEQEYTDEDVCDHLPTCVFQIAKDATR